MPLDVSIAPRHLTATLFYQQRTRRKPERYVGEPPPGVVPFTGIEDPREVRIEDARGRESEFTLDRNGFALVQAPSRVQDSTIQTRSKASTTRRSSGFCSIRWVPSASWCSIMASETPGCRMGGCRRARCITTTR